MKLANLFAIVMLAANVATASCSSSKTEVTADMRRAITIPQSYAGVKTSNGLCVNYTASASNGMTVCEIVGPQELVERVEVVVEKDRLVCRTKNGRGLNGKKDENVVINISGLPVGRFESNSGSVLNVNSSLKAAETFRVDASSGSVMNFSGKIQCKNCEVDMSSGSVLNMTDAVISGTLEVDASSGAALNAGVEAHSVELDMSSGSAVNLTGKTKNCEIDASSGSVVSLTGLEITGFTEVDASSGSVVNLGKKGKMTKARGAIVH